MADGKTTREAELEDALREITDHFLAVLNGPLSAITFENGARSVPTIKRALELLEDA